MPNRTSSISSSSASASSSSCSSSSSSSSRPTTHKHRTHKHHTKTKNRCDTGQRPSVEEQADMAIGEIQALVNFVETSLRESSGITEATKELMVNDKAIVDWIRMYDREYANRLRDVTHQESVLQTQYNHTHKKLEDMNCLLLERQLQRSSLWSIEDDDDRNDEKAETYRHTGMDENNININNNNNNNNNNSDSNANVKVSKVQVEREKAMRDAPTRADNDEVRERETERQEERETERLGQRESIAPPCETREEHRRGGGGGHLSPPSVTKAPQPRHVHRIESLRIEKRQLEEKLGGIVESRRVVNKNIAKLDHYKHKDVALYKATVAALMSVTKLKWTECTSKRTKGCFLPTHSVKHVNSFEVVNGADPVATATKLWSQICEFNIPKDINDK